MPPGSWSIPDHSGQLQVGANITSRLAERNLYGHTTRYHLTSRRSFSCLISKVTSSDYFKCWIFGGNVPCQHCHGGNEKLISKSYSPMNTSRIATRNATALVAVTLFSCKTFVYVANPTVIQVACVYVLPTLTCTITALRPETCLPRHIPRINSSFHKIL